MGFHIERFQRRQDGKGSFCQSLKGAKYPKPKAFFFFLNNKNVKKRKI